MNEKYSQMRKILHNTALLKKNPVKVLDFEKFHVESKSNIFQYGKTNNKTENPTALPTLATACVTLDQGCVLAQTGTENVGLVLSENCAQSTDACNAANARNFKGKKYEILHEDVILQIGRDGKNRRLAIPHTKILQLINPLTGEKFEGSKGFARVYRIRALKDIPSAGVKAGDIGGWISGEDALSQEGDCWLFHNSVAIGKTAGNNFCGRVTGNARLFCSATILGGEITDDAKAYGKSIIMESAHVGGKTELHDEVVVAGEAKCTGKTYANCSAKILNKSETSEFAILTDETQATGNSKLAGNALLRKNAEATDHSQILGGIIDDNVTIGGKTLIFGNPWIRGGLKFGGESYVHGEAIVCESTNKEFAEGTVMNKDISSYRTGSKYKTCVFSTQDESHLL